MNLEQIAKEKSLCKQLYFENKGGCNWGKCKDCGVLALLHKVETGEVIEDEGKIKKLKAHIFGDSQYL